MTNRVLRGKLVSYALVAAGGLVLCLAPANAAQADPPPVAAVTFDEPDAVSIEYGGYWGFTARSTDADLSSGTTITVTVEGAPATYVPGSSSYDYYSGYYGIVTNVYPGEARALTPGSYTVKVEAQDSSFGSRSATASLTVTRAALGVDLRVLADSSNPTATIVSARFTGRFVDEYQSSTFEGAALSPAGEWHITLKDEDGQIAVERNFERAAGDDVLATSFYWTGAKPDTEYSATAEFVPTGASAANFDIASATTFTYTPQDDPRPVPSSTATAKPAADLPDATGFGLPLWAVILSVLLILGLGALVTVFSIRLNSRPVAPSTGPVSL